MSVANAAIPEIQPGPARLDTGRFSPGNRRVLSGPGLRAFLAITERWGLTAEQRRLVLGVPSRST